MECTIKRWKSLPHLDRLRAFDPQLAQTPLLAKVLGALLGDAPQNPDPSFFPTDTPSASAFSAVWRYTPMIGNDLCPIIQGFLDIDDGQRPAQRAKHRLRERPRKRRLHYDFVP